MGDRQHPLVVARMGAAIEKHVGWWVVLLLTLWIGSHLQPSLWSLSSWPNGGDIASHLLYVDAFKRWFLEEGRISGWLPEVFAGFPALTYYFPLPFIWMALLSLLIGLPLAFKWLVLLPSLLLPATVYWSTGRMGWPGPARLLGATATAGFLLNESSSIWGGNLLALFSGEFAFSWGVWLGVIYWGVLDRLLRQGGAGWLLAAVLVEVATALSHGFAILAIGFGSLFYLLLSGAGWSAIRVLFRLHLIAFLLLGFWLLPLLANHGWTIPNDTPYPAEQWLREFWPTSFWWLLCGIPPLAIFVFRDKERCLALLPFLAMAMTGLCGAFLGAPLGLANVRFLPYLQLGGSLLLAGALGWWIACGFRLHGAGAAPPSDRYQRLAMTLAVLLTAGVAQQWAEQIHHLPLWARTFWTGYEGRSQWTLFRRLADQLQGGLAAPRIAFEHDPANNDLGSTRALEALPFFGSRPVLEGLYMESAISAPFIYQLQAEISAQPSGPLSRYPPQPRGGSVQTTLQHMRELAVDTLLLRSTAMKERFAGDDRFYQEAEIGPFHILRLREGAAPLVELLSVPLLARNRQEWLDHAYNRFIMEHPYASRTVYTDGALPWTEGAVACQGGDVRLESLERERLIFTTDRPGCPHLLRISYHPKWRVTSGEEIHLVEPFFMLVFPRHSRMELAYLPDRADTVGRAFTLLGGLLLFAVLLPVARRAERANLSRSDSRWEGARMIMGLGMVGGVVLWGLYRESPAGNLYQTGHLAFNQRQYAQAATLFDQSFSRRPGWALRAEALFWAGLAWERAGNREEAKQRYQQLAEHYPAGHFVPEALYRRLLLHHQQGEMEKAAPLLARLEERFPESTWYFRARDLMRDGIVRLLP
ncbi:MAG: 6-pyruvoyl-tetrahydropterin synthase-related protein [Magnetococcus sp. XQGC-1]